LPLFRRDALWLFSPCQFTANPLNKVDKNSFDKKAQFSTTPSAGWLFLILTLFYVKGLGQNGKLFCQSKLLGFGVGWVFQTNAQTPF